MRVRPPLWSYVCLALLLFGASSPAAACQNDMTWGPVDYLRDIESRQHLAGVVRGRLRSYRYITDPPLKVPAAVLTFDVLETFLGERRAERSVIWYHNNMGIFGTEQQFAGALSREFLIGFSKEISLNRPGFPGWLDVFGSLPVVHYAICQPQFAYAWACVEKEQEWRRAIAEIPK